ncbi:hypothetical protein KFK09_023720 [Dendrobium nobile]|uniref:F-box/LRR-repeat protein 15-like leucin rich repeat domain-containing protein n=1 Tax=Dendrobium nobile TaxID=94219 RepID=A0A8T3AC35_DENNO|nr:hypothetical protein KFK09_023720 [Dendrobium nobile]
MAKRENAGDDSSSGINAALTDDVLRVVLSKLEREDERDAFGLVCMRWLQIQNSERRRLRARAGSAMLQRMADRFSGLMELDMSQSVSRSFFPGVADSDLSVIAAGFPLLRILNLSNCKGITDAGMITLGKVLTNLQSLDVSNCKKLTDTGLVAIAKGCHDLRSLKLDACRSITDDLFQSLSQNCSHLEELGLASCFKITDSGIIRLVHGCRWIKCLDVSKCGKVGDAGISRVAEVCSSSLKVLKLLDCCNVGDKSILSLANSCHNLETLVICGCRYISDESVKSLALSCYQSLRILGMSWCSNITDLTVNWIFSNCRYLMALDIGSCDNITDSAFEGLICGDFESDLKVLKVTNLPRITVAAMNILLESCKSLDYLDLRSCTHITKLDCEQAGLQFPDYCKVNFDGSLVESDGMVDLFF